MYYSFLNDFSSQCFQYGYILFIDGGYAFRQRRASTRIKKIDIDHAISLQANKLKSEWRERWNGRLCYDGNHDKSQI